MSRWMTLCLALLFASLLSCAALSDVTSMFGKNDVDASDTEAPSWALEFERRWDEKFLAINDRIDETLGDTVAAAVEREVTIAELRLELRLLREQHVEELARLKSRHEAVFDD